MRAAVRILGIDPGSRLTGYGIVDCIGTSIELIDCGSIGAIGEHADRLRRIFNEIERLVARYSPQEVAIERVFVHRNADSALKLGQARAAALCGTFGAQIPVYEYAARHIKKAVVGRGAAEKAQVQHMIRMLLGMRELPEPDTADALAAALCHAHERGAQALIQAVVVRS
ncbi:MAG TPA: crossover junction endodeoxyribonuclease RuvC [Gammaproteobacteria bacterium]|nr:crossover junction endodeoxyribonuclease RuvC [Gammaproteobacteria bacterium]